MHRSLVGSPSLEIYVALRTRFSDGLGTAQLMLDSMILRVFPNLHNSMLYCISPASYILVKECGEGIRLLSNKLQLHFNCQSDFFKITKRCNFVITAFRFIVKALKQVSPWVL